MSKYRKLNISDNIIFARREDAIKDCFGYNYSINPRKASAETGDRCSAWFPKKEYMDRTGKIVSGAQGSNWKNHFEKDGEIIVSWLYDNEPNSEAGTEPRHIVNPYPAYCFWCEDSHDVSYKYMGTYLYDENASELRNRIYRRIGTEIDLTPWYVDNGDFDYYDFEKEGIPALKRMYLQSDFAYTQSRISAFLNHYIESESEEGKRKAINERVRNLPILKLSLLITELIDVYNSSYSVKIDETFFYREGVSDDDIGRFIVDVLELSNSDDNGHNRLLRTCFLGENDCGKILALYDDKFFLYSIPEKETEFYLDKLGIVYDDRDDITEKHNKLYFWKQCIEDMGTWSPYKYYEFLRFEFGQYNEEESFMDYHKDQKKIYGAKDNSLFLITWNPKKWQWKQAYSEIVSIVSENNTLIEPWTVNNGSIKKGDFVYLMRLGEEPKGIIAKGIVNRGIYLTDSYDKEKAARGEKTKHVDVKFFKFLDYQNGEIIPYEELKSLFPEQNWTPQSSGISIRNEYYEGLNRRWDKQCELVEYEEREVFYRSLKLPQGVVAKRYDGMNRVHFKVYDTGFAVIDMNKTTYNLASRKEIFEELGIDDYETTDYMGPNHAMIKGIGYRDTEILYKIINYAVDNRGMLKRGGRIISITTTEIEASEEEEYIAQKHLFEQVEYRESGDEGYEAIPEPRLDVDETSNNSRAVYPRNPQKRINALQRAGFVCEVNPEHTSFISKKTNMPYMETHHLIPLEYWKSFKYSLDVEANIVCLCSNCHNEIHYGKFASKLVETLYDKRKNELMRAGIEISLYELEKMYYGGFVKDNRYEGSDVG